MIAPTNHEERVEFLNQLKELSSDREKVDALIKYLELQNEIINMHQKLIIKLVSTEEQAQKTIKDLTQSITDIVELMGKK